MNNLKPPHVCVSDFTQTQWSGQERVENMQAESKGEAKNRVRKRGFTSPYGIGE